jgi:methylamine dehydrogenase heavy chain
MSLMLSKTKMLSCVAATLLGCLSATAYAQPAPAPAAAAAIPQAEVSDVAIVPPATPKWVYISGGFGMAGVRIFDGESGKLKMKGLVQVPSLANIGLDPLGHAYYVSETIWSKGNRGIRQDMVSIYDTEHLKLQAEIPVPGRLLGGTTLNNFVVSTNGKLGFVYTLAPSSSINVVDLEKRKFQQTVQLPGCAALFAAGADGVAALCADGSMATVTFAAGKPTVTHTAPFFSTDKDPIFDQVVVDRKQNVATFITYTGKIYTATLGASPQISGPWSIQTAAGLKDAVAAPLDVNWIPGGRQPLAINRVTGLIYVLMHVGEQWSQKEAGQEIWVVDGASHKVLSRHATPGKVTSIQVSQEAKPMVYVGGGEGKVWMLDGETMESKSDIERVGGGSMYVVEPS